MFFLVSIFLVNITKSYKRIGVWVYLKYSGVFIDIQSKS